MGGASATCLVFQIYLETQNILKEAELKTCLPQSQISSVVSVGISECLWPVEKISDTMSHFDIYFMKENNC